MGEKKVCHVQLQIPYDEVILYISNVSVQILKCTNVINVI